MDTSASTVGTTSNDNMRFGKFIIDSSHIFYRTELSAAFVNLRPIVPGHVLIVSNRIVPTMDQLRDDEYADMWNSVRTVQSILRKHYTDVTAFNVAVQDGKAAGQSIPHVHVHVLPRRGNDFERNDDVYDQLEEWVPKSNIAKHSSKNNKIDVPDDNDRIDRTYEMMKDEASIYRTILLEGQTNKTNDDSTSKL